MRRKIVLQSSCLSKISFEKWVERNMVGCVFDNGVLFNMRREKRQDKRNVWVMPFRYSDGSTIKSAIALEIEDLGSNRIVVTVNCMYATESPVFDHLLDLLQKTWARYKSFSRRTYKMIDEVKR